MKDFDQKIKQYKNLHINRKLTWKETTITEKFEGFINVL